MRFPFRSFSNKTLEPTVVAQVDPVLKTDVLLVGHDRQLQQSVADLASEVKVSLHIASNNKDALTLLSQHAIGTVLIARKVQESSALALAEKIREQFPEKPPALMALANNTNTDVIANWTALGGNNAPGASASNAMIEAITSRRKHDDFAKMNIDKVTGLPNRAVLRNAWRQLRGLSGLSGKPITVALLKVDQLQNVLETHGDEAANKLLEMAATTIQSSLRYADFIGHWHADGFAVILPNTDKETAVKLLRKARRQIAAKRFEVPGRVIDVQLKFSAGIVEATSEMPLADLLDKAASRISQVRNEQQEQAGEKNPLAKKQPPILLIDDDKLVVSLILHRLQREGHEIIHFADGKKAFEAAKKMSACLVILDIKLPGMDGFELLDRLRKLPAYEKTPIMMLTSMAAENDIVRGFDMGVDAYVTKPFSPIELIARVNRLMIRN